jgi:hypothetical protein
MAGISLLVRGSQTAKVEDQIEGEEHGSGPQVVVN